jgi:hypothetical protein
VNLSCEAVLKFFTDLSGQTIAAAFGAFVGATAAFLLQGHRERIQRDDQRYASIIQAQHTLFFMWGIVGGIKVKLLDPARDLKERHREIGFYNQPDSRVEMDFKSLGFLYRPTSRNLLAQCFNAERQFNAACRAVRIRNSYLEDMTEEAIGVTEEGPGNFMAHSPTDAVRDHKIRAATESLYKTVDAALPNIKKAFLDLEKVGRELFPDKDFLEERILSEERLKT